MFILSSDELKTNITELNFREDLLNMNMDRAFLVSNNSSTIDLRQEFGVLKKKPHRGRLREHLESLLLSRLSKA